LYPTLGARGVGSSVDDMLNVLSYSDGRTDLLRIADICGVPFSRIRHAATALLREDLLRAQP